MVAYAIAPAVQTIRQPREMAMENLGRKLLKLECKYDWPEPLITAAWRYGYTLVYESEESPHAMQNAWSALIAVARKQYGSRGPCVGRAIRRRFANVCYELNDELIGIELPGFRERWFMPLFLSAKERAATAQ